MTQPDYNEKEIRGPYYAKYLEAMNIAQSMIDSTDNRFAKRLGRLIQVCAQHWQNYADPELVPFTNREELIHSLNYELDETKREIWS